MNASRRHHAIFGLLTIAAIIALWGCRSEVKPRVEIMPDSTAIDSTPAPLPPPPPPASDTLRDSVHAADTAEPQKKNGNIRVTEPADNDTLATDHFKLSGTARTFENSLAYRLVGTDGVQLAAGRVMSKGSMGHFNPFTVNVNLRRSYNGTAMLHVFQNSAKDGGEIDKITIPVIIGQSVVSTGVMTVQVFYPNAAQGSNSDCGKVFSVSRSVPRTEAMAESALGQLLQGPTMQERERSYGTEIPSGAKLKSVTIDKGVATADFNADLNRAAGTCRITAIRAQIERTLRQFPTVHKVVISVDGQTKGVLQP